MQILLCLNPSLSDVVSWQLLKKIVCGIQWIGICSDCQFCRILHVVGDWS